ncbi:MAG: hypothetical protein NW217_09885 [Hyphomicrobiaceae bacterium]|nr:hypothetical protein [Hyphomicrobiaceae bacterium]
MIADETPPHPQDDPAEPQLAAANDNGERKTSIDAQLLAVARAIGRQIACEELASLSAANDNHPESAS